jgi:hypothetical protein
MKEDPIVTGIFAAIGFCWGTFVLENVWIGLMCMLMAAVLCSLVANNT